MAVRLLHPVHVLTAPLWQVFGEQTLYSHDSRCNTVQYLSHIILFPPYLYFTVGTEDCVCLYKQHGGAWEEKLFRIVVRSCYFSSISWVTGSELCLITGPLRMEGSRGRQGKWGGLTFFSLSSANALCFLWNDSEKGGLRLISCQSHLISSLSFFLLRFIACHVLALLICLSLNL